MSTHRSNKRYGLNIEMTTPMVEDYQSVLKKFWQTVCLEGEAVPHQHCLQWKLGAAAISHWRPFHRGGRGWGVRGWFIHHISWSHWRSWEAKQWKGTGEGWDQDRGPQVSECFGTVLADTTCSIARQLGTVHQDWQTSMVLTLFKMGDRRARSNYREITLVSVPGYWRGEFEQRLHLWGTIQVSSWLRNNGPA